MDKLIDPDIGLMIWTVVTFVAVVLVLGRFAWRPLLQAIEAREDKIQDDLRLAEKARLSAEKLKADYDKQMAQAESRTRHLLAEAHKESQNIRDKMLAEAQEENERLSEKARQQLALEQQRLVRELRAEVVSVSVKAAEKIMRHSVNKDMQEKIVQKSINDFGQWT